jgi:hypothetical protein
MSWARWRAFCRRQASPACWGVALAAFGWIGMTTLVLSLPATERAYSVRGQSRMLVDFAELLAERVAQRAH